METTGLYREHKHIANDDRIHYEDIKKIEKF
jgi:hypothetical protein